MRAASTALLLQAVAKAGAAGCTVSNACLDTFGDNLHSASEIGVDAFQAERSPTQKHRTAPLAGLWTHQKPGFYHDGRFPTLLDVVEHYNRVKQLALNDQEKRDLVEFLRSL